MSDTQSTLETAPDAVVASGLLAPIVLGLQALAVNGKHAHWHVRGQNFLAIHELLDSIVDNAHVSADLAAERIIALGMPVDARVERLALRTSTRVTAGFSQWDDAVRALVADIDIVIDGTQAAIEGLDGVDLPSQDVAIAVMQTLAKDRWFLFAHLAE